MTENKETIKQEFVRRAASAIERKRHGPNLRKRRSFAKNLFAGLAGAIAKGWREMRLQEIKKTAEEALKAVRYLGELTKGTLAQTEYGTLGKIGLDLNGVEKTLVKYSKIPCQYGRPKAGKNPSFDDVLWDTVLRLWYKHFQEIPSVGRGSNLSEKEAGLERLADVIRWLARQLRQDHPLRYANLSNKTARNAVKRFKPAKKYR